MSIKYLNLVFINVQVKEEIVHHTTKDLSMNENNFFKALKHEIVSIMQAIHDDYIKSKGYNFFARSVESITIVNCS